MYRVIIDFITNRATPCPGEFLALLYFNNHRVFARYLLFHNLNAFTLKSWKTNKRTRIAPGP